MAANSGTIDSLTTVAEPLLHHIDGVIPEIPTVLAIQSANNWRTLDTNERHRTINQQHLGRLSEQLNSLEDNQLTELYLGEQRLWAGVVCCSNDERLVLLAMPKWHQQTPRIKNQLLQLCNLLELLVSAQLQQSYWQKQASVDPLTGLPNRRAFFQQVPEKLQCNHSVAATSIIVLIDINNFKLINDTVGHTAGDQLLVSFAYECSKLLEPNDVLARFGGDEFILMLPDTCEFRAKQFIERLARTLLDNITTPIPFGISHGMAAASPTLNTVEKLLQTADTALKKAKQSRKRRSSSTFCRNALQPVSCQ